MIKKCCGNDVAAFAKLSHVTYVCTATDGNMSVVALNLEKGFFAVATSYGCGHIWAFFTIVKSSVLL